MRLFDALRIMSGRQADELAPSGAKRTGILSPFATDGQLQQIVWSDILGTTEVLPVTRAEAMTIPAVVAARNIIIRHIAGTPLVAQERDITLADQPAWLQHTTGASTPWHRMAWTLDDLLFTGWSLWWVERSGGAIQSATRVPYEWWEIDADGHLLVNAKPVNEDEVILFAGPNEGLLEYARRTIRAARNVEEGWAGRVRSPIPLVELHQTTPDQLDDDEAQALVDSYATQRLDRNGAVLYTPYDVEVRTHGAVETDLFVEARNAIRLDIGNFTGLPAEALDGSLSTASLTYTTQEGTRTELGEALRLWFEPVEQRLSQDDVVPQRQRVRFDWSERATPTPAPTGPTTED